MEVPPLPEPWPRPIRLLFFIDQGVIKKNDIVKILGRGELKTKVDITAHAFSKSAIEAIEKLGGKIDILRV